MSAPHKFADDSAGRRVQNVAYSAFSPEMPIGRKYLEIISSLSELLSFCFRFALDSSHSHLVILRS
jgi:hypothetical protein